MILIAKKQKYANVKNPKGKYKIGTKFRISGQKIKVENGSFQITTLYPRQTHTEDDAYFTYRRITKQGKLSKSIKTGLRGNWGSRLDRIAKIIK